MLGIVNFFIGGLVLWIASVLFPSVVRINGLGTLLLATFLIWLISFAIRVICVIIALIGILHFNIVLVISAIFTAIFATVAAIGILSVRLEGFSVIGFWPKVIIAFCFSVCQLKRPDYIY